MTSLDLAPAPAAAPAASPVVAALRTQDPALEILDSGTATAGYGHDRSQAFAGTGGPRSAGPIVALPTTIEQVRAVVRAASAHGVTVVPRGAGTGLSGGANAEVGQLVLSTERLDRIVEISAGDEVAVVEPGVLNADLNRALEPFGLFYAPDPASHDISTIGGNIATNAGGLHCAKYGVTRESVLALDVVLADGSLVSVGHRSIKGVTGLDLASLFVGSEGTLGIVVGATLRLHPIPVARRTITAFFDDTTAGVNGIAAIRRTPVRPAAVEFLDEGTLDAIDLHSGTDLRSRGSALALIELDGYGIEEQTTDLRNALESAGGRVTIEADADAVALWELRRSGRGINPDTWFAGGDMAVPVSRLAEAYAELPRIAERHGVSIAAVAHAGDGNLHPVVTLPIPPEADRGAPAPAVHAAMAELVDLALELGGTVTGEHGLGSMKREFAALELSPRSLEAHHAVKAALDPLGLLNPHTGF